MTNFTTLTAQIDAAEPRLGRLTLNRPKILNPLSTTALSELAAAASWFDGQAAAVVVVTGAGSSFCAGFDLNEFAGGPAADDGDRMGPPPNGARLGAEMADALEAMSAITVARIHGHCVGGGFVLAAACDLRIAADNTRFSIPEVALGIPLAWGGIPRLVREIGPAATKELVLTCRPFGPQEAQALGFLNRVVPLADLDAAVAETTTALLGRASSLLRITKRQVHDAVEDLASSHAGWAGEPILAAALADPDARAASRAYLDQRGR